MAEIFNILLCRFYANFYINGVWNIIIGCDHKNRGIDIKIYFLYVSNPEIMGTNRPKGGHLEYITMQIYANFVCNNGWKFNKWYRKCVLGLKNIPDCVSDCINTKFYCLWVSYSKIWAQIGHLAAILNKLKCNFMQILHVFMVESVWYYQNRVLWPQKQRYRHQN